MLTSLLILTQNSGKGHWASNQSFINKLFQPLAYKLWILFKFDWLSVNFSNNNYNLHKGKYCLSSFGLYVYQFIAIVLSIKIPAEI